VLEVDENRQEMSAAIYENGGPRTTKMNRFNYQLQ
jgi:hypothetical protein